MTVLDSTWVEMRSIITPTIVIRALIIRKYLFEKTRFLMKTVVSISFKYTLNSGKEKTNTPIITVNIKSSMFKFARNAIVKKIKTRIKVEPKSGCKSIKIAGKAVTSPTMIKNLTELLYFSSF